MWKLNRISATNLCAFKNLDYTIPQNHTTLIFGNNMDNDSQGSNGSGKSALIEAIAIVLTGSPLRKVNGDEIINDCENDAVISATLVNDALNEQMTINRHLFRKQPQYIQVIKQTGPYDTDREEISQASVADYNKYILDTIGLTKDEIYANFILSKHKYTSFLSSSDREKKEIINRFSNGLIVDESIIALQSDMAPIQASLKEAETIVAQCNGQVSAIQNQINEAIIESTEKSQNKANRIASMEEKIANKRAYIREQNSQIQTINKQLDELDVIDSAIQDCEASSDSVKKCYSLIAKKFNNLSLRLPKDYASITMQNQEQLKELEKKNKELQKEIAHNEKAITSAKTTYDKLNERFQKFQNGFDTKFQKLSKQMEEIATSINQLETCNKQLKQQRTRLENDIAVLHKQLAGVITCPKCQHEFTLHNDINVTETKLKLQDREGEVKDIEASIEDNATTINDYTEKSHTFRASQDALLNEKSEWSAKITEAQTAYDQLTQNGSIIKSKIQGLEHEVSYVQEAINAARTNLFNETFEILDEAFQKLENALKQAEINIANAEGVIRSYEESITEIQNSSETDMTEALKRNLKKYEQELNEAIGNKEQIEQRLRTYQVQESTFIEFKTHLANTKIEALGHITNEFLQAIGSDIRIVFSGYTVLKSGKIRDKISISLVRDGVDCGSFDKFSEGEKARVNLANILAMHKLTNVNCDDGKGLDLLILDEILEATDEQGLSNIFNALNQLQITAMVVSHGNIAEGYPYKTVVNKLNGISYIND